MKNNVPFCTNSYFVLSLSRLLYCTRLSMGANSFWKGTDVLLNLSSGGRKAYWLQAAREVVCEKSQAERREASPAHAKVMNASDVSKEAAHIQHEISPTPFR